MKQWIKRLHNAVGKAIGAIAALLCFGTATALAGSINLSEVTANTTVADGTTLTGKLGEYVKISIADGATVTLDGVAIDGYNNDALNWAGITCEGGATIVLKGANTVKGFYESYPGIFVPSGKTLTIKGDGSLVASSNGYGAGIGGGSWISCGNIVIEGGTITATGGDYAAGIGGGSEGSCGDITITGGTIDAKGGKYAPGIGGGDSGSCGTITIADTVTKVTATKGKIAPCSIGKGSDCTCGTVTIGGTVYADGIEESPYTYAPAPVTYTATLKDGTEDAANWTITPSEGLSESNTVTVAYAGSNTVKSVKAVKKATYTLLSAATAADIGKVVCAAGHLHDAKTAVPDGCTAVGILGKVTETGHGLILALQDATAQNWNTINGWTSTTDYAGTTLKVLPDDAARGANLTSYTALGETTVANWAVAQKSDYDAIFTNLGSTTGDEDGKVYDANVNDYITGVGGAAISGYYWSATENGGTAWKMESSYWVDYGYKPTSYSIRPVLGFKSGATEEVGEITVTSVEGKTNEWTFAMPAANVEVEVEYFTQEEVDSIAAAKAAIEEIGEVDGTEESKEKIAAARKAYDALTDDLKEFVENYGLLPFAEAKVDAFGEIDTLAETNTSALATELIAAAREAVAAVEYDEEKTPDENMDALELASNGILEELGAALDSIHTVSFAEGTPDEENWTIAPYADGKFAESNTVTVAYAGTNTVKSVKATMKAAAGVTAYTLAESTVGMIVGTDGKAYAAADKDNLPTGVTAAGMVAYKSGSNGLAIALADEASTMNWSTANGASGAAAHTPTVTGQTWKLPSQAEWQQMFGANGGNNESYTVLNTAITTAGGTALQNDGYYWSSTPVGGYARGMNLVGGSADWLIRDVGYSYRVRACLAFSGDATDEVDDTAGEVDDATEEITVTPVEGETNKWTFAMPATNVVVVVEYFGEEELNQIAAVEAAIDEIGTVDGSEEATARANTAFEAYKALTEAQQDAVTNSYLLEFAEAKLDAFAALDTLAETNTSARAAELIAAAREAVAAVEYDEEKTPDENMDALELASNGILEELGAALDSIHTVSFAEGTPDAENWTIAPYADGKFAESNTVTVAYAGTNTVKSVKAVKKATYTLLAAATAADIGKVVCAAGHLHDAKTAVPDGCTAVGIIGKVTETGHGLILALQDATAQNWNTINGWTSETGYAGTTLKVLPDDDARGANLTSYTALGDTPVSNWAVAQKSDYEAIFINLGSATGDSDGKVYDANVNAYITTGVGGTAISGNYWSATGSGRSEAWRFRSSSWQSYEYDNTDSFAVRPVLGFGGEAADEAPEEIEITVTPVEGKTNEWTFQMPDGDVKVEVAYLAVATFEVDGETYAVTTNVVGEAVETPEEDPVKIGHTFAGWFTAATGGTQVTDETLMGIADTTFYAQFRAPILTIENGVLTAVDFNGCTNLALTIPDTVTTIGDSAFYQCTGLASVTIPGSVKTISHAAFRDCSNLTSVTIEEGVTTIGERAFARCVNLASITIPGTVTAISEAAFSDCKSLTSLTIPGSVKTIGPQAFQNCTGLESVTIEEGVETIGRVAFDGCENLSSVTIPDSVKEIGDDAFAGCSDALYEEGTGNLAGVKLVDGWAVGYDAGSISENLDLTGVRGIAGGAFAGCDVITSVIIPDGVATIPEYVFNGCDNLTGVTIPDSVTSIGEGAFGGCDNFASVTIPDSVTSIGKDAFEGCNEELFDTTTIPGVALVDGWAVGYTDALPENLDLAGARGTADNAFRESALESVTIPGTVARVPAGAFMSCSSLASVTLEEGVTAIDDSAFIECSALESVEIPDTVTAIGPQAFVSCAKLASVTVPGSVAEIGSAAFGMCNSLTNITIEAGVTNIGMMAFAMCSALESVEIPGSVTAIGSQAFLMSMNLASVTIPSSIMEIGQDAFLYTALSTVNVDYGDGERVKEMLAASGFDVSKLTFVEPLMLTFDPAGGEFAEGVETNRFIHAGAELGELPEATLTGYTLAGWFTAATNGYEVAATNKMGDADATVYAQWTINQYTITFDSNGGEGEFESITLDYGSEYGELPVPFREGWAFYGWIDQYGREATAESVLGAEDMTLTARWGTENTLIVGEYFKATLADLGYPVPTNGTVYSVKALGLPAGMSLKYNAAVKNKKGKVTTKAKSNWWIEGVPTAALDYSTNPAYLVITIDGVATTYPLSMGVLAQSMADLGELPLNGTSVVYTATEWLKGIDEKGWTVTGLPTGMKYTEKAVKNVAPANSVYGKATKAGLFTITAKKKAGSYYETLKYRVLVRPAAVDETLFGALADRRSTAYVAEEDWNLKDDVAAQGGNVAKVTGLPAGMTFAASNTYAYKNAKKKTGKYLKQSGQTIVGTPTKAGTYVVTFTKNVKSGKKTVAKTAQILWTVAANDEQGALTFNTDGGVIKGGCVGLKGEAEGAFTANPAAKVTASGLPAGISLVNLGEGNYAFSGFTTKAGTYLVTVKATVNGNTTTQRVALEVSALPSWAKGTYNGYTTVDGENLTGIATITVSSVGKVSGKLQESGTNWTFTAASYVDFDGDKFTVPVTAKYSYKVPSGKKTVTKTLAREFTLTVFLDGDVGAATMVEDAERGGTTAYAWKNLWGSTYKAAGKALFTSKVARKLSMMEKMRGVSATKKVAYKTWSNVKVDGLGEDDVLNLKVTTGGAVTATYKYYKGKKDGKKQYATYTCATTLIPSNYEDGVLTGSVFIYFPPNAKVGFAGWQGQIDHPWATK